MDQKLMPLISKVKSALGELEAACASYGMEEGQDTEQEESAPEKMPNMNSGNDEPNSDMTEKKNIVKALFKKKGY